jgi:hypothetical protein
MPRLLIITGPQGSGNHLWSKVLAETPTVSGWKELTEQYWVSHGDEPFVNVWENPELFATIKWDHSDYYVTSISCPYMVQGAPDMSGDHGGRTPKYDEFILAAKQAGFETQLAVIGRDKNILGFQQSRVRKTVTYPRFLDQVDQTLLKYDPVFISTELLYLYGHRYLQQLSRWLDFPIEISVDKLDELLKDNANAKYLQPIKEYWLDDVMKEVAKTQGQSPGKYGMK